MKTRIIHTKIWDDDWFTELSEHAQYLFFYIITNHRINLCGIYEMTNKIILRETKMRVSDLLKAKDELSPKVLFYANYIWVVNASKYGGYLGEKNEIAKDKELALIPLEVINGLNKIKTDRVSVEYRYPSDTSINHKSEIINHKSECRIDFLQNIPNEVIQEFSEKFNCYEADIQGKGEDLYNYCLAKGKKYKDYKAFLRNAVKKDFGMRPPAPKKKEPEVEISEEERKRNINKLSEMRNKIKGKFKIEK